MILLGITLQLTVVSAWSSASYTSYFHHRTQFQSSSTSLFESTTHHQLSSAYDTNLPPALVGEAVRSALRSDRGVCFDFTSDRYQQQQDDVSSSRLVSVVDMCGEGTNSFINAKFSQSTPNINNRNNVGSIQLTSQTEFIRKGHMFDTAYLTSKGHMIDRLSVLQFPTTTNDNDKSNMADALLVTSPGNSGSTLYDELSPLVFPMDKVKFTSSYQTKVITLACSSLKDAQTSFNNNILKLLMQDDSYSKEFEFPQSGTCHHYRVTNSESTTDVYLMEHTFLSSDICHGYTLLFQDDTTSNINVPTLSDQIWDNLTHENNDKGPVGMGSLEYETLRIEAAIPGYGNEMSGDGQKNNNEQGTNSEDDGNYYTKANPLELHLQSLIDTEKGCYQGQEGVASVLKNKRGPPRQLYQVVFNDIENDFNSDDVNSGGFGLLSIDNDELMDFNKLKKQADPISNDTRQPRVGDSLYVLGSNESIQVGKITSVAQPNGTGEPTTVALCLAKRPDSILKAIKEQGLDLPRWWEEIDVNGEEDDESDSTSLANEQENSGMIQPPPLDPLLNLEIVIEGSYTMGRLQSVPSRRYKKKSDVSYLLDYEEKGRVVDSGAPAYLKYEFENNTSPENAATEESMLTEDVEDDDNVDELLAKAEAEAAKAKEEAEKAEAEAIRKEQKMKLLKAKGTYFQLSNISCAPYCMYYISNISCVLLIPFIKPRQQ